MQGLDLARKFFHECVKPIITAEMPELLEFSTAGLIGYGSDVLQNDDSISRDHQWGPRLSIFIEETRLKDYGERLNQLLKASLPATFAGFPVRFRPDPDNPDILIPAEGGSGMHLAAILSIERFMEITLGVREVPVDDLAWLAITEQRLLEFTSGELFHEGLPKVREVREKMAYFPQEVWFYRLAYAWHDLSQYLDLIGLTDRRGDTLSRQQCLAAVQSRLLRLTFLLNRQYAPQYHKWLHRQFYKLPYLAEEIGPVLEEISYHRDSSRAIGALTKVLQQLLQFQQTLPELVSLYPEQYDPDYQRTYFPFELTGFAEAIHRLITGPLASLAFTDGAIDQWVTNPDLILYPNRLMTILPVYFAPEARRKQLGEFII